MRKMPRVLQDAAGRALGMNVQDAAGRLSMPLTLRRSAPTIGLGRYISDTQFRVISRYIALYPHIGHRSHTHLLPRGRIPASPSIPTLRFLRRRRCCRWRQWAVGRLWTIPLWQWVEPILWELHWVCKVILITPTLPPRPATSVPLLGVRSFLPALPCPLGSTMEIIAMAAA
jgi:hypothetical protein